LSSNLALLDYLPPALRAEADWLLTTGLPVWLPLPGPQTMAYLSEADIIGFGGAAGGGKTDLACGKALTQHRETMILRPIGSELIAVRRRLEEILGDSDGYNGRDNTWRIDDRVIDFGSLPDAGDEKKYQGRPHDLLVFDEAANFLEHQVRFLMAWNRTTIPGQHCQSLLTFNPPTTAEGRWIIQFFGPWLDKTHPAPAEPGELRWFVTVTDAQGNSFDIEVTDSRPRIQVAPRQVTAEFDLARVDPTLVLRPKSRTFIPSRVTDNPYLMGTAYMATLQALPEPLRSQMLYGDFQAGMEDDAMQLIPTAWVDAAQRRWQARSPKGRMLSMGIDVARGGKDNTIISARHEGMWFDELKAYPGSASPDGQAVTAMALAQWRDRAPIHIDVLGVGSSPYDFLKDLVPQCLGVNVATESLGTDKSGVLTFANLRSELWWRMREALDPVNDTGIALPPDTRLAADLTAPRWKPIGRRVMVESRESIIDRIGRSPDYASAVILALIETPLISDFTDTRAAPPRPPHDPYLRVEHDLSHGNQRRSYDPLNRMR
jgi:hypothetical protein